MLKQIFIPIALVMIFIVVVGLMAQKGSFLNLAVTSAINSKPSQKTVTIGSKVVDIEVANTDSLKQKGLGERNSLAENSGMLFTFDSKGAMPGFWMKGMRFPLDIIWISAGKIAKIDKNIAPAETGTPDSKLKVYYPDRPVDSVLEVNAGYCDKNGIKVGDSVKLP